MTREKKHSRNDYLRAAREERSWSQGELAERVGSTEVNVNRWENGQTFPTPYFRQRLCKLFEKTSIELGLIPANSPEAKIWNMPTTHNPFFIGREKLLDLLHQQLSTARTAALTQTRAQALYGLGGIGKTQTASEYAFRYFSEYAGVLWVRAASRETLVADFVTLAELLDLPGKDKQEQSQIVAAVKRWLAHHENWLLILDNADDLRMAQEFLPISHKGYVLFTTRAQAAGAIAASIEVEKLPLQEGVVLLLRWSKLLDVEAPLTQARAEDRADAERIVREMDGLPLALVQAGAYVDETGCSLAHYLRLYATHRKDLLARRSSLFLDYADTVATTWSLSFEQIEQQSPIAADLLRLCAFLAPDAIPEELLLRSIAEPAAPGEGASDLFVLDEALEVLRRYSLVRRDRDTNMLSIHRLVQAVLRESMDQQTQRLWAERTVRVINAAFPETDYGTGATQQNYLPHVQECSALITQYHLHFPEAARLLYQAGVFLHFHGFYTQSQSLHQQVLAMRKQVFGSDHPAVAESLNHLAVLARNQGDYEQAEKFHRQALSIREKTLGPDHSDTVLSLNNLGVLYCAWGKYDQAYLFLKRALSTREQELGSEHPNTLMSFVNLAKLYLEQRKYEQAEQLLEQTLQTSEQVLSPEDPQIAQNLSLLARLYYEQGDYNRAEVLGWRSLAILEKTLGPDHHATAERLDNLAELAFAQGRYIEAQSLCRRTLAISKKVLGPEHPDTIAYREHLTRIASKIKTGQDGMHHPVPPPC